ncbi:MAG: hypothetical protein CME65_00610 [Halobacteriovoraceae bacterium]|nr:hypothetical protein [Halobacteriovoraceae bacterium]
MMAYLSRLNIFFKERYPLLAGFLSSIMGVLGLYLIWARLYNLDLNLTSPYLINAALSMFLLTMIMRLGDELKDREADRMHFPERCLPSGKVFYRDVYYLMLFLIAVFVVMNLIWGGNLILFSVLLLYLFLFYHYFFIPQIISKSLILALVTHNPLIFVAMLYTVSIFNKQENLSIWSLEAFSLSFAFWMSSFGWETARKIRVPSQETAYETYSMVLGTRGATLLPMLAFTAQFYAFRFVCKDFPFYPELKVFLGSVLGFYNLYLLVFMINMDERMTSSLQKLTEGYLLISSLVIVWMSLLSHGLVIEITGNWILKILHIG